MFELFLKKMFLSFKIIKTQILVLAFVFWIPPNWMSTSKQNMTMGHPGSLNGTKQKEKHTCFQGIKSQKVKVWKKFRGS